MTDEKCPRTRSAPAAVDREVAAAASVVGFDAESGNGWASGALVEISGRGRVRVLWRAPS